MRYSNSARQQLTDAFEGNKLRAYPDSKGVWTIGRGHTRGVFEGMTCSSQQSDLWFDEDVSWAEAEVNREVKIPLTQNEFDALVDFVFNCGAGNFEHSTLLRLLNAGDIQHAANEFEKWDKCDGKPVAGLLRRRLAEKAWFTK